MIKVNDTYSYKTIFTQEDVEFFANLTGDFNPIHLDKEFAAKSEFGRQIVQGVLVSCAFSKVFGTQWPGKQDSYFISQDIMYFKPVYVGEAYQIDFECVAVDPKRHIGTIEGIIHDKDHNNIVKVTARIFCKSEF